MSLFWAHVSSWKCFMPFLAHNTIQPGASYYILVYLGGDSPVNISTHNITILTVERWHSGHGNYCHVRSLEVKKSVTITDLFFKALVLSNLTETFLELIDTIKFLTDAWCSVKLVSNRWFKPTSDVHVATLLDRNVLKNRTYFNELWQPSSKSQMLCQSRRRKI